MEDELAFEALRATLGNPKTCSELIDSYEDVLRSTWLFTARLLGDAGARAVMGRAISLASRDVPLLLKVRADVNGIDFSEFRDQVLNLGCDTPEVMEAMMSLVTVIFKTLSDLAGDALTGPILQQLKGKGEQK